MYLFILHNSQEGRIIICTATSRLSLDWNLGTSGPQHTLYWLPNMISMDPDSERNGTEKSTSLYASWAVSHCWIHQKNRESKIFKNGKQKLGNCSKKEFKVSFLNLMEHGEDCQPSPNRVSLAQKYNGEMHADLISALCICMRTGVCLCLCM